jgi:hypothetical protein
MDQFLLAQVVKLLKTKGVTFDEGLSDAEIQHIEAKNEFFFPPDLKAFLQYALPVSIEQETFDKRRLTSNFPAWRSKPDTLVKTFQANLLEGIIWSFEHHDNFWLERWGERPAQEADAIEIIRRDFATAPILVPVFIHRCIPSKPRQAGNPVYSIVGTDIITYGMNLLDYFKEEFHLTSIAAVKPQRVKIEFWEDLWVRNNTPLF